MMAALRSGWRDAEPAPTADNLLRPSHRAQSLRAINLRRALTLNLQAQLLFPVD